MCSRSQLPLPGQPLSGMLNKFGAKVRLQFKMEIDQLWIGTKGESLLSVYLFVRGLADIEFLGRFDVL